MTIKSFIVENTWLPGMTHGWGNGYAAIPKGHPCYGLDYDQISDDHSIDVHGGLTFAAAGSECGSGWPIPEELKDHWIVGFDTAHAGDDLYRWSRASVEAEAKRLADQFQKITV